MKQDVKNYVKNCDSYQKNKIINKKVQMSMDIISTSSHSFEKIFLDILEPLTITLSGNVYILTIQDSLSKFSLGVPIPIHKANTVAETSVVHFVYTYIWYTENNFNE